MDKWKLNKKTIKGQIAKAKEQTRLADEVEPRAETAYYDRSADRIVVELSNGADFRFSPSAVQELVSASPDELAGVEISPSGRTLRWQSLDADLSLPGLMAGIFGTKIWMAHLGRIGGQATSQAKTDAARLNGIKGGRPTKDIHADRPRVHKAIAAGESWEVKKAKTSPSSRVKTVPASALTQSAKTNKVSSHRRAGKVTGSTTVRGASKKKQ
jgi:hypothetical protein